MKSMIIRPLAFLLPFLLIVSPVLGSTEGDTAEALGDVFEELGISMEGTDDFIIQKDILREGFENTFRTIIAKRNERLIKVEIVTNIDVDSANRYIEQRRYIIESLYKRIHSPYPGMVSKTIDCPDEFRPNVVYLEIEENDTPVYILYSTPRLTYGACAEDLIEYKGGLIFVYREKEKTLYRIDMFIPKGEFKKTEFLKIIGSFKFKERIEPREKKSVYIEEYRGDSKDYNLIIIGFDPLGVKHVGAYGYSKDTTPNLDKFSKNAYLFKNAISASSWTLPAFMTWFTSLYPSQHRIVNKYSRGC